MKDDIYDLTVDGIGGLMKIGAREIAKVSKERDGLIKFAMAVEIIPRLERAGVLQFPLGMEMHKKAQQVALGNNLDKLQKLAYLAKHTPKSINHGVKEISGETKVAFDEEISGLTQAFLGIIGE